MLQPTDSLVITTLFESPEGDEISNQNYRDVVLRTLKKILPPPFFEKKESVEATYKQKKEILQKVIPIITRGELKNIPGTLSFFVLSRYCSNSFKFFFEMISRWLTPGRRLNVVLVYASDFRLTNVMEEVYTICEVMISVSQLAEWEEIQRNFPMIEAEIALGIHSPFYAHRIMEIKGLSADDKTALIQGYIAFLLKRFPGYYESDVFAEMQHVLITCRDEFKEQRRVRHLARIIGIQYFFRKALKKMVKKNPQRRHVYLKVFRTFIQTPTKTKPVLALLIGVNFLKEQENFGEKHIVSAIRGYIPSSVPVEGSFLVRKSGRENIPLFYIEMEKEDGSLFAAEELSQLRSKLSESLKNSIEYRLHSVFMPSNEEEIMRNIVALTSQIKFVKDIPQVSIIFDKQAGSHLYFTVILARLLKTQSVSIADLFKKGDSRFEYLHDRTKITGYVRRKYEKEATVFRLKLRKDSFLRTDQSIDLYKARLMVVKELIRVVGEIRDYNGGMISKQCEILSMIQGLLSDVKEYDEHLLENFFYSLAPVVSRALLDPNTFTTLFLMLLSGLKEYKQEEHYLKFHSTSDNIFSLIIAEDPSVKERLRKAIHKLEIPSTELAYASVKTRGASCMGYICCSLDPDKKTEFLEAVSDAVTKKISLS